MDEFKKEALIPRKTLTQLVSAWTEGTNEIRQAFALLCQAERRLKENFKPESYLFDLSRDGWNYRHYEDAEPLIKELKKDAWRGLIARMDLKRLMSIRQAEELEKQLQSGEGLPEIEESQILGMMEGTVGRLQSFMEEAVVEVFELLRPHHDKYKTNSQYEVGPKVVLSWYVESGYGREKFRANYHREKNLIALDNVFHLLDGKGQSKTYRGELVDAIQATPDGKGETTYFKFKCFKNHNLHLAFTRLDLVAQLNQVAGGARLKKGEEQVA